MRIPSGSATPVTLRDDEQHRRRRAARMTALWVGVIAVAIYIGFIASGILRA